MTAFWNGFCALYMRELRQDAGNLLAYIFAASFVSASILLAFQVGGLFEAGQAELVAFFQFHPWLYIVLMPALSMRAWSDEARTGTLETLLALPVPTAALVLAKFMAAWTLACLMLAFTTPLWLGLSLLGPVDHGATLTAYLGSGLLAGAYLAIGMATSAANRSQVLSFVMALALGFLATAAGLPLVSSTLAAFLPLPVAETLAAFSMLDAFAGFERGVIEARAISYFLAVMALGLSLTGLWVDHKRGAQA